MPETKAKKLPNKCSPINNRLQAKQQATDFTAQQQLKLEAGDLRMTRMQIRLYKLRLEMEKYNKEIRQLLKGAQMNIKSDVKS